MLGILLHVQELLPTTYDRHLKYVDETTGNNLLHLAATTGNDQILEKLLEGMDAHASKAMAESNDDGKNPVHLAAELGHTEYALILVSPQFTGFIDPVMAKISSEPRNQSLLLFYVQEEA